MSKAVLTEYSITTEYPVLQPLTIAHVSDLHERQAEDILTMLRNARPDLVFVTGDTLERYDNRPQYNFDHKPVKRLIINCIHYTNYALTLFQSKKKKPSTENAYYFLSQAVKIAPVYLSLGNHEQKLTDEDYAFFREQGITVLDNTWQPIECRGCHILLGGISTWDYEAFLRDYLSQNGFKLLLCHNPQFYVDELTGSDIALTLSGHTHGGQIRIGKKGMGFFVPGQGLFGKYAHGSFFGGKLIVSAGCSNTVVFPRIRNPRELVLIHLKGKEHGTL